MKHVNAAEMLGKSTSLALTFDIISLSGNTNAAKYARSSAPFNNITIFATDVSLFH